MAKSSPDGTIRSFVMFRVTGDKLIPDEITEILGVFPLLSYRKGEEYQLENSGVPIKGKTGVWYFGTDKIVSSTRMSDHIVFLLGILCPEGVLWGDFFPVAPSTQSGGKKVLIKLGQLQKILHKQEMKAAVTIFWHGVGGARPPAIPRVVSSVFRKIPIEIETDFEIEEGSRHVA
jgi:hypothetical protein